MKIKAATTTVAAITQRSLVVHGNQKLDALTRILEAEEDLDAAIVFVRTKLATDELADRLEARGFAAAALNGDMTQGLRERVIGQLKNGQLDIVVATDVAARGIDVPRVSHVFNYDIPYDTEAYVHRIGRTGRAGRQGNAILFVTPREKRMLSTIERATRQKIEPLKLPTLADVTERRVSQFKQQVLEVLENEELFFFNELVGQLRDEHEIKPHLIAGALAFLLQRERPLQLDPAEWPEILKADRSDKAPREARADKPRRDNRDDILERRRAASDGRLLPYRIAVGRMHGVTPKEIVGAIANEGGIEGKHIGQIHLFEDYSVVELPGDLPDAVLTRLQRTRVCGEAIRIRADDGAPSQRPQRPAKPGFRKDKPFDKAGKGGERKPKRPFDGPKKSFDGPKREKKAKK